jgi:hypothetical protein
MRRLELIDPAASPEEAAAIVAALERFMRATAPAPRHAAAGEHDPWREAALLEGVQRSRLQTGVPHPWINT